jgi:hypothetical protein
MRYATWTISRPEGTTPEPTIRANGGWAKGGMMLDNDTVLGYISDDVDLATVNEWNVTIKTQEQAMTSALLINAECFLADDGTIQAPPPDIN